MAGHAREIETIIYLKFQNSVDTVPKGTRHVTLLYHQVGLLKLILFFHTLHTLSDI